jgi:uncharacterized protein (DUF2236 family)
MDGYFSEDSAVRRIGRESVLLLGGPRALLMQVAHPLVAAGVARHSGYGDDPWRRLARTMTALYTIVFGTRAEADHVGDVVCAVHRSVRGRLSDGTRYSAEDPALQRWVHATLVDTGIVLYDALVSPLSLADREAFHDDMRVVARVFGVPLRALPRTYASFEAYLEEMLRGDELCVTEEARAVASLVFRPPVPPPLRPALAPGVRLSLGLLPPELREAYGITAPRLAVSASSAAARRVVAVLPGAVRDVRPGAGVPFRMLAAFAR